MQATAEAPSRASTEAQLESSRAEASNVAATSGNAMRGAHVAGSLYSRSHGAGRWGSQADTMRVTYDPDAQAACNAIVHNGIVDEGVDLLLKPFNLA
jgi:hypothetical protein